MRNESVEYEDLSPECFERLVVLICKKILGLGTKGFANGPDGGRDAKFVGKAELFPSAARPWDGKIIIQAKHSNSYSDSFSNSSFFSPKSKNNVINKECPKIKKLRDNSELDYYMLFSNRKLTAEANKQICQFISEKCNLPEDSIALFGLEELECYIDQFPDILKSANISPIKSPLIISPDELAEIIEHLSQIKKDFSKIKDISPADRTPFSKKNELNKLSDSYGHIILDSLSDFSIISDFLSNPENKEFLKAYESVIFEFRSKIIAYFNDFDCFDKVLEHIIDLLVCRDYVLRKNKVLTRKMVFFMYWNCDIGKSII